MAVDSDEPAIGNSELKKLEDRVRELERILGCKTMENEIDAKLFPKLTQEADIATDLVAEERFPMKTVADVLGVSRSNLVKCLKGKSKPRGPYLRADDAELLLAIRSLVDARTGLSAFAGMARWFVSRSLSMHLTRKLSHGQSSQMPGYPAPTFET